MKTARSIIFFFSLLVIIFFPDISLARDNVVDWYIKDFRTEVVVNTDSSLTITETILADCGEAVGKHGVFRVLPIVNKTKDGNFITPVELISITDAKGNHLKYQESRERDTVTYKIGDPKKTVQGENTYIIKYKLKGVIRNLNETQDELYFDILGSFWDLEIDSYQANIIFPQGITNSNSEAYLYSGNLDSRVNSLATYKWKSENDLEILSTKMISENQGITISVTFPSNILTLYKPSVAEKAAYNVSHYVPMTISSQNFWWQVILTLVLIFLAFFMWYKYGRDPKSNRPIVAEFEAPENMTPLEISLILKETGGHNKAITATIINLAVKGYLKIEKLEKKIFFLGDDYKLIKTSKKTEDLYKYEEVVLSALFKRGDEVKLSSLKNKFATDIRGLSSNISSDLKERGLIDKKGIWWQIVMISLGFLLVVTSFRGLIMLAGIAFIIFGAFMRRLTPEGSEMKRKIKGFKLYLETAEKYRARFYEKENMLELILPYAILFDLTGKWLKKMRDIYGEDYFKNHHLTFMTGALVLSDFSNFETAISDISRSVSSHVASSSSGSAGGGGVGGGGGGGGGGGW
ncbi:MAG: DUF2207 domain-containing protein [Patescibacteria group bacterium]|nr:DUF2207 domain-containing protein [Patescibacteria group bacterium]